MISSDAEFDHPSLRIDSRKWWKAIQNDLGKHSEQYQEAQSFVHSHTKVRVEKRNDLSATNSGWAVIFENSDWWALYFEKEEDAQIAAREWNAATPKLSWRQRILERKPK